jgi:hypothetical protein
VLGIAAKIRHGCVDFAPDGRGSDGSCMVTARGLALSGAAVAPAEGSLSNGNA